jgi:hif-contiguous protein B
MVFEYRGLLGSVCYSREDQCFFGKILGILGLITYEAGSIAELEKEFRFAVDDFLHK